VGPFDPVWFVCIPFLFLHNVQTDFLCTITPYPWLASTINQTHFFFSFFLFLFLFHSLPNFHSTTCTYILFTCLFMPPTKPIRPLIPSPSMPSFNIHPSIITYPPQPNPFSFFIHSLFLSLLQKLFSQYTIIK